MMTQGIGYNGIHHRLRKLWRDHLCTDCGGAARDWSLKPGVPEERLVPHLIRSRKAVVWFSRDLSDYEPRCRRCHLKTDGVAPWESSRHYSARTHCAVGHPFDAGNTILRTDGGRRCRICREAADRKRWGH